MHIIESTMKIIGNVLYHIEPIKSNSLSMLTWGKVVAQVLACWEENLGLSCQDHQILQIMCSL